MADVVEDGGAEDGDAFAAMRRDLLPYFGLPFYRAMLERSGFGDDIAAFDAAASSGDGQAMQAAISDRFIEVLPGGDMLYVDQDAYEVKRVSYTAAGNRAPVAVATSTPARSG